MLVCYKCLVGGLRQVSPAARRDLLSSPNYPCKSGEKRRADERTRTAFPCSLFPGWLRGHRSIERLTLDRQHLVSSLEEIRTASNDASMRTIASIPLSNARR